MSRPGPQPGVYLWRDQTYLGQDAVALAAGVAPQTVADHLRVHGNLDRLGVGRGRHASHKAPASKPISDGSTEYPSIAAMARAAGVRPKTAQKWVRNGQRDRLLAALMAADARKTAAAMREAQMIDTIRKDAA